LTNFVFYGLILRGKLVLELQAGGNTDVGVNDCSFQDARESLYV
jgi:hypothetical protein